MSDRDTVAIIDAADSNDNFENWSRTSASGSGNGCGGTREEDTARKTVISRSRLMEPIVFLLCFAWNFNGEFFTDLCFFEHLKEYNSRNGFQESNFV